LGGGDVRTPPGFGFCSVLLVIVPATVASRSLIFYFILAIAQ
jgi:hypothetical protein